MCRNYTFQIDLEDYRVKKMYLSEDDVSSFAQKGKLSYVSSVAFHPESRLIVVGALYGTLYFFRY